MNQITPGLTQTDIKQFESGTRCYLCYERYNKPYGMPTLCEDCGGRGELKEWGEI